MSKSHTLTRNMRYRAVAWSEKSQLHRQERWVPRTTKRVSNKNLPRQRNDKHEWIQYQTRRIWRVLVSLQVWPNLEWKGVGRQRDHLYKRTGKNKFEWLVRQAETSQRGKLGWGRTKNNWWWRDPSRSVKEFQLDKVGNAKKRKPSRWREKRP